MTNSETLIWHQQLFIYTIYLSWILYPTSLFLETNYEFENVVIFVDIAVKVYVSIVLMYKFNPWFGKGSKNFSMFDRKLAWHAGFFLFISTISITIIDIIRKIYLPIRKHI